MNRPLALGLISAAALVCMGLAPSPTMAQGIAISGKVPKPLALDAEALARLPRREVKVTDRDGRIVAYQGVLLAEVLRVAGLGLAADELRGPALEFFVTVEASDGYRVVFALPELSPAYTDRVILLADRLEGRPLDPKDGPLRIVVPGEKRQARWVRQVVGLKVGKAE